MPRRLLWIATLALALLAGSLPLTNVADAHAQGNADTADAVIARAAPEVRNVLSGPGPVRAREALDRVLRGPLNRDQIISALGKPKFADYAYQTLLALDELQDVPGVEKVLKRLSSAGDEGGIKGAAFELKAGAHLKPRLAELSADVGGMETDALLTDGTIVEMKALPNDGGTDRGLSGKMISKAIDQLKKRVASTGARAMLVTNRQLTDGQLRSLHTEVGDVTATTAHESGMKSQLDGLSNKRKNRIRAKQGRQLRVATSKKIKPVTGNGKGHRSRKPYDSAKQSRKQARRQSVNSKKQSRGRGARKAAKYGR